MTLATHEVQQLNQAIQSGDARVRTGVRSSPVASARVRGGFGKPSGDGPGSSSSRISYASAYARLCLPIVSVSGEVWAGVFIGVVSSAMADYRRSELGKQVLTMPIN